MSLSKITGINKDWPKDDHVPRKAKIECCYLLSNLSLHTAGDDPR